MDIVGDMEMKPQAMAWLISKNKSLWRRFIADHIFDGPKRLQILEKMLSGKHKNMILSNGEAHEICCALYAVGLHAAFDAVIDTGGTCFWPRNGFKPKEFGTDTGYGDDQLLDQGFVYNRALATRFAGGFSKDSLLCHEISKGWATTLPNWMSSDVSETKGTCTSAPASSTASSAAPPTVIYIDDNVETEMLPEHVKVISLPPEVMGGITSAEGLQEIKKMGIRFDELGERDIVVWDFDCTIAARHLYKTLHMGMAPPWLITWGKQLTKWWIDAELDKEYKLPDVDALIDDNNSDSSSDDDELYSSLTPTADLYAGLSLSMAPELSGAVAMYPSVDSNLSNLPVASAKAVLPPTLSNTEEWSSWRHGDAWLPESESASDRGHGGVGDSDAGNKVGAGGDGR